MKKEVREVYKCDYCNRLYQIERFCVKHEESCRKRPDYLRPCHDCSVLKKVNQSILTGGGNRWRGEDEVIVSVLFCEKRDCFIYPPSVTVKGNAFELDKLNIEMPKECEFQKKLNSDYED